MVRVACVQSHVKFGDAKANSAAARASLESLRKDGVDLAIFPEAYLTGYCVSSAEEARTIAIPADSEPIRALKEASDALGILAIVGFAERAGDDLYNAAALFEPGEPVRFYRKSHLPELGLDKFVCQGPGPLRVFETRLGKIGVLICFDQRFPEPSRVLTLQGADLIALPTNWPQGANVAADTIAVARAAENRVFVATCDRVGEENGFKFIGKSKIINPVGRILASAGEEAETIVADLDFDLARQKRTVTIPGKYETDVISARRPELYGELTRDVTG